MIDRGDIRQAIDRCSNIWASLPGAGYGQLSIGWQPDCKIQRSGRNGQRDWWWAESPRLSPLWLSASSSPVMAVNHYVITPLPGKAQRDKNARELKLANAAITDMQMRQRDVAALDAKYTKELADAKAENDARVMMLPLVVVGCTSKQSAASAWSHHRLRVDNAASPRLATPLNGIISPQRGWSLCKNNWRNPEVY